jgi:hypothetical protein
MRLGQHSGQGNVTIEVTSKMMYTVVMINRRPKWHVIYYTDTKGRSEVFDFINDRKDSVKANNLALLAVLEEQGPQLPRPYADILVDGIHEMRVR